MAAPCCFSRASLNTFSYLFIQSPVHTFTGLTCPCQITFHHSKPIHNSQWPQVSIKLHLTFHTTTESHYISRSQLKAQVCRYVQSKRGCTINVPIPMWILTRHEWLGGQEGPRNSQTPHLALEAPFFDHQVASSLRQTLPLWYSIPPGSLAAETEWFEARFESFEARSEWSAALFGWSAARFGWTTVDPVARSPKAGCMRQMYLNYLVNLTLAGLSNMDGPCRPSP